MTLNHIGPSNVLFVQIETSLAGASHAAGAPGASPAPSLLIQQALEAIARISKGFNANLCTRVRPEIGEQVPSPQCNMSRKWHQQRSMHDQQQESNAIGE